MRPRPNIAQAVDVVKRHDTFHQPGLMNTAATTAMDAQAMLPGSGNLAKDLADKAC